MPHRRRRDPGEPVEVRAGLRGPLLAALLAGALLAGAGAARAEPVDPGAAPQPQEEAAPADAAPQGEPGPAEAPASAYAREGPYVGVGGHFAVENFDVPHAYDVGDSGGVNARIGYRTHPNLAGEIVYDWVAPFDVEVAGVGVGRVEMHFVSMNARWFPFTGAFQPFLSAGVGLLVVHRDFVGFDETDRPAAGRFGGGLDVYLDPHVVLSAEAVYVPPFDEPVQGLDFVLVGGSLQVRF